MLAFTITSFADDKPDDFHIFNETSPLEPGFNAKSPFRTSEDVEYFYEIISKMNQPRDTPNGTNPHGGVDIEADAGTTVYPIANGIVVHINPDISGQMGTVWIKHGNFIVLYRHIDPDDSLCINQEVEWTDPIGTVDTVKVYPPAHLHISWCTYATTTYPGNKLYNFYDHASNYKNGRDFDFYSKPEMNDNTLYIYVYSKSQSGRINAEEVKLYYKIDNGPWKQSQLGIADPVNFRWKIDFTKLPEKPQPGQTIEYYLVGYRDDSDTYPKPAFYPAHYYNPPITPAGYNTSSFNHPPETITFVIAEPPLCPGQHNLSYGAWEDVSTEAQCQRRSVSCNNCSYSDWIIDTTHAWTNNCDTSCNDCSYTRNI